MLERGKLDRGIVEIVHAERMVPKDRLLRRTAEEKVAETGYLFPKAVFIDGTHIKVNANIKKPGENTSNMTRQQRFLLPTQLTRRPICAKGI